MKPPKISDREVSDPKLLRERINQLFDRQYELLSQISGLEERLRTGGSGGSGGSGSALSEKDQLLLRSLAVGSPDSHLPGQPGVAPEVDQLPPTSNAIPGTLVVYNNLLYRFDGATRSWLDIGSAVPGNMMTTDTNQTPGAAVVKTWTAAQVFNGGLTAGAQVKITAGGLDIDAGGANIDGGVTVASGALTVVSGLTDLGGELYLSGVAVIDNTLSPYTVPDGITIVACNTSGGAITVTLPASVDLNRIIIVYDISGNAGANNITIGGGGNNINGAASLVLNVAYSGKWIQGTGSDYNVIGTIVP